MRENIGQLRRHSAARWAYLAGTLIVLFGWPLVWNSHYVLSLMVLAGFYAILAVGLQVLMGHAGQVSIGQAAFMGLGAYTVAILSTRYEVPVGVSVILAVALTGAVAYVIGRPILRLKGYFLALATMGLGQIFVVFVKETRGLTGGQMGIGGIPWLQIGRFAFDDLLQQYYLLWMLVLMLTFLTVRALDSRVGRALRALATNEIAASTLGIRTPAWKLRAFVLSATYAGLAGALYACMMTSINWRNFDMNVSILALLMVIVGGLHSPVGAVAGAVLVNLLSQVLSTYQEYSSIIYSVALIVIVLFLPGGLLPWLQSVYTRAFLRLASDARSHVPATPPPLRRSLPVVGIDTLETGKVPGEGPGVDGRQERKFPGDDYSKKPPYYTEGGEEAIVSTGQNDVMLRLEGVTVSFGGLRALNRVTMDVKRGSITALIGPNGAGKTTLFNVITGLQRTSEGRVMFMDREVSRLMPPDRAALGIARTFQNLRLFQNMTVLENVMVGRHRHERAGLISAALGWRVRQEEEKSREEALRALRLVGLDDRANWPISALPYGDQRLVEIARALATEPRILLLDEPAAGMNASERAQLVERIGRIRDSGVTVLLVEHDLRLVMGISDVVYVLHHGEIIAAGPPHEVQADSRVIEAYVGVQVRHSSPSAEGRSSKGQTIDRRRVAPTREGQACLVVHDLSTYYGPIAALREVSFEVHQGEVLAILGSNGAGKSTLLRTISGLLRPRAGRIVFEGREITHMAPEDICAHGVCHVPEGRLVFPSLSVHDNLRLGAARRRNPSEIREDYEFVYTLFPRLAERRRQAAGTLSGGEQQMLAIGRALMGRPRLLLLDEPLMGLAPVVVEQILQKLQELNHLGLTIVVVEQNAERVLRIAHRAVVLQTGVVALSGPADVLAQDDRVRQLYLGGDGRSDGALKA